MRTTIIVATAVLLGVTGLPVAAQEFRFFPRVEEGDAEPDEIETDRDSFTPATTVVGRHRLVVETAWSFIDNPGVAETHSFPELVTRFGLTDWFELRAGWNYEVGGAPNSASAGGHDPEEAAELERESALAYGFKTSLTSQRGLRPQSALIVQASTPTSGIETATSLVTTYAFGWELPNRWKWDSAIRYGFDSAEGDHFNIWAPSTVLKVPLGERWAAHAEYFSIISDGSEADVTKHYLSPGVHYLVTPNFEIGTRMGWGLNDEAANYFVNVGAGVRF
jgi:hypothetical protein